MKQEKLKRIARYYCGLNGKQLRRLAHGQLYRFDVRGRDFYFVHSILPGMRTADTWVKDIDTQNDDPWRPIKKALKDLFSTKRKQAQDT